MIKAHWNLEVSYFQSQIAIPKMDGSFDPIFNRLVVQFIIFCGFSRGSEDTAAFLRADLETWWNNTGLNGVKCGC